MSFPINVFEDVNGKDFSKHNKKNVTEDFVTENFKECGWKVYRPFNDTGIDLIATKEVCPKGCSNFNDFNENIDICNNCNSRFIQIKRFIQVKTREIKGNNDDKKTFGYTLKSKDFRTDPRHIFLLYSDFNNSFIIIPMYEYMKIFFNNESIGKSHFGVPSFRYNNNKLNSLTYTPNGWFWNPRKENIDFNIYSNENGMNLITNPTIDLNLNKYIEDITKMKFKLFYDYSKGQQTNEENENKINHWLQNNQGIDKEKQISNMRKKDKKIIRENLSEELINSIEYGYLVKFRGVSLKDE